MNSPNLDHRAPPCRQGEKHRQEFAPTGLSGVALKDRPPLQTGEIRGPQMGRIHRPLTYSDIENETAATPCGSLPMRTPVVRLTERGGRTARRVAEGVDIAEEFLLGRTITR